MQCDRVTQFIVEIEANVVQFGTSDANVDCFDQCMIAMYSIFIQRSETFLSHFSVGDDLEPPLFFV